MIGDSAYDSDRLDQRLRGRHGVELIAPHKNKSQEAEDATRPGAAMLLPAVEDRAPVRGFWARGFAVRGFNVDWQASTVDVSRVRDTVKKTWWSPEQQSRARCARR